VYILLPRGKSQPIAIETTQQSILESFLAVRKFVSSFLFLFPPFTFPSSSFYHSPRFPSQFYCGSTVSLAEKLRNPALHSGISRLLLQLTIFRGI
jgi:hypothetical protein